MIVSVLHGRQCDVCSAKGARVSEFSAPNSRKCSHDIPLYDRPTSLIEPAQNPQGWHFISRQLTDNSLPHFFRERDIQISKFMGCNSQFVKVNVRE